MVNNTSHQSGSPRNVGLAPPTVLIVDDDAEIVDLLETALATAGYNVVAGLGAEALRIAHDVHPNLILMDLMMPDMDGAEMSRRLRADPGTANIPIIAMSAKDFPRNARAHMLVNDVLAKPFHLKELYGRVAHWCGDVQGKLVIGP